MLRRFTAPAVLMIALVCVLATAAPVSAASPPAVTFVVGKSKTLGPGLYWIAATGTVTGTAGTETTCFLGDGTDVYDSASWNFRAEAGSNAVYYLTTTVSVASGMTTFSVNCGGATTSDERFAVVTRTSTGLGSTTASATASLHTFSGTSFHTIASVSLGAGKYWLVGKVSVRSEYTSDTSNVTCRILIKPDKDQSWQSVYYNPQSGYEGMIAVQTAHVFSSTGSAKLQCTDLHGHQIGYANAHLIAYKVGRLTRVASGGSPSTSGTASSQPQVTTTYRNASVTLGTSYATVLSLKLPAGEYWLNAKTVLKDNSGAAVDCELVSPAGTNLAHSFGAPAGGQTGLYVQALYGTPTAETIVLECRAGVAGTTSVSFSRITALAALD